MYARRGVLFGVKTEEREFILDLIVVSELSAHTEGTPTC